MKQENKERYIIEPGDFRGSVCSSTYTKKDGIERVAYRDGQTLEAYLVEYPQRLVITSDELDAKLKAQYESLKTSPAPITEEQYDEWLNCLPPCRWHTVMGASVFHISERLTGNLVQWCMSLPSGRCYGWTDEASITADQLKDRVCQAIVTIA